MRARLPAFLLAAAMLWPQPAAALDPKLVAERLLDHLGQLGVRMEWKSIDVEGEEVSLDQVWIIDGNYQWLAEKIYLREFYKRPGYYLIGAMHAPQLAAGNEDWWVRFESLRVHGMRVPTSEEAPPAGTVIDFDEAHFDAFVFATPDRDVLRFANGHLAAEIADDGAEVNYSGAVESFHADLRQMTDPMMREAALAMGYHDLKGYLELELSVRGAPAAVAVDYIGLSFVDAGTLGISGELTPSDKTSTASGGIHRADVLLGELALTTATLRYDDDGFAAKLLDHVAKLQRTDVKTVGLQFQALAMLQAGAIFGIANVPQVLAALQAFLAHPSSLEITANPAAPAPLERLRSLQPGQIAEQLSLTISANN